ncbi:MAG: GDYXXLXY domain-containing protein, partial [Bacteroidota bacterium]
IDTDAEGFARIKSVHRKKPQNTANYVTATVRYHNKSNMLFLGLPFDRYYMEESKAPDAEIMYNNYVRSENRVPAYALVAIKDGRAVLTDVIIDGLPVKEYIIKHRNDAINKQL